MNGRVTNIELASYFGISRQAIAMLAARGIITKGDDGLFDSSKQHWLIALNSETPPLEGRMS